MYGVLMQFRRIRPPHTVLTKSQMERSLYNYEVIEYLRLSERLHL